MVNCPFNIILYHIYTFFKLLKIYNLNDHCCKFCNISPPSQPHLLLFQPLFFPLSRGPWLWVPSIRGLTFCTLDRSECESIAREGPKEMGHSAAWCIIHESPLLSGQLFSIRIPDVVQSVLHSLSWLLAIDHKVAGCWISAGALCYRLKAPHW